MTLRELLQRERDRAAEAAAEKYWGPKEDLEDEERYSFDVEKSQHLAGFNHALDLLMPVVEAALDLKKAYPELRFSAYNNIQWVGSEQKLYTAIKELEAKLGDK